VATAEQVVAAAFADLADNGPTCFPTDEMRSAALRLGAMSRNDAARAMLAHSGGVMGSDDAA
jgi:hypothetical protein